jgi:hypothetical protein
MKKYQRSGVALQIRIPTELRDFLAERAITESRSMNGTIKNFLTELMMASQNEKTHCAGTQRVLNELTTNAI